MKDFQRKLFPDMLDGYRIAYNPTFVVKRFIKSCNNYGENLVWTTRLFQKAREMFVASLFLYAYSDKLQRPHFLAPVYNDNAPDIHGFYYLPSRKILGEKDRIIMNIEVTDWVASSKETLSERVRSKLRNKKYEPNCILLVAVSHEGHKANLSHEIEELAKTPLPVRDVWALGSLRKVSGEEKFHIINIYSKNIKPELREKFYFMAKLDFNDLLNNKKHPADFIFLLRGHQKEFIKNNFRLPYPSLPSK